MQSTKGAERNGFRAAIVRFFFGKQTSGLASDTEKQATFKRIHDDYPGLYSNDNATVELLYTEAKAKYESSRDRFKQLDGKAGTLITIVTTGFGAFAILGDPGKLGQNAWVGAGLLALAVSFVFALIAQVPRSIHFPELSTYVALDTVKYAGHAVRIKYELTRSWVRDADTSDRACAAKARLLNISTALLGIGLAALTLNYALPPASEKPVPTVRVLLSTPMPAAGSPTPRGTTP